MTTIKHNKIKNVGLLFELLTRQITADVLRGKSTSVAEQIMQRHFSPKTELGKELLLYRSFFNINELSETKAFKFVSLLLKQRTKLDENKLSHQKYNLIRDIKRNYDLKEFCSTRVPAYKVYASIYQLFETHGDDEFYEIDNIATAQFTLVEHLMGKYATEKVKTEELLIDTLRTKSQTERIKSYNELLEEFNTKYAYLSDKQKNLLREYIYNISTKNKTSKLLNKEAKELYNAIHGVLGSVDNTVTQIKLREVLSQLQTLSEIQVVDGNHITSMLLAYEIYQEMENMGLKHD